MDNLQSTRATVGRDAPDVLLFPPLIPLTMLVAGAVLQQVASLGWLARLAPAPWRIGIGVAVAIAGLAVALCGVRALRRHGTNVRPSLPSLAIVTDGIFARTRNPIYVGGMALSAGVALALGLEWALLLHPFGIILLHRGVVLPEERYLEGKFGELFRAYKASVRRYL